jgi:Zn-dependent protease
MKVRIRFRRGVAVERHIARNRKLASVAAALLTPAAAMALVLGVWRLGSDLQWTGEFAISRGLFSHWQVWIAMAGVLQTCAVILNRFGSGGGDEAMP